jgi:2,3-bisphosphoglycerate-independent phosphoglycerate mutase
MSRPKPVILLILDGFGIAPAGLGNAVAESNMPVIDQAIQKKKMMPNVSMDAALKAAQMAAKRLGQQGR